MSTIAKFSIEEYERIIAAGAFSGKNSRRIELIQGELREMHPIGPEHADAVAWLTAWSLKATPSDRVGVRAQSPLSLELSISAPEPDIVWVGPNRFRTGHPKPRDVLLLIEVAETSLDYDRGEKAELYALAKIKDYWIANLVERTVEVYRDPQGGRYQSVRSFGAGEFIESLAVPEARLSVDALFDRSD